MGTTYRVYVHGTRAKALKAWKDALERWDFKTMKWKRPAKS